MDSGDCHKKELTSKDVVETILWPTTLTPPSLFSVRPTFCVLKSRADWGTRKGRTFGKSVDPKHIHRTNFSDFTFESNFISVRLIRQWKTLERFRVVHYHQNDTILGSTTQKSKLDLRCINLRNKENQPIQNLPSGRDRTKYSTNQSPFLFSFFFIMKPLIVTRQLDSIVTILV